MIYVYFLKRRTTDGEVGDVDANLTKQAFFDCANIYLLDIICSLCTCTLSTTLLGLRQKAFGERQSGNILGDILGDRVLVMHFV